MTAPAPTTCEDLTKPASWLCEQVGGLTATPPPTPPPAPLPVAVDWWADPTTWLAVAVAVLWVALLLALALLLRRPRTGTVGAPCARCAVAAPVIADEDDAYVAVRP